MCTMMFNLILLVEQENSWQVFKHWLLIEFNKQLQPFCLIVSDSDSDSYKIIITK